MLTLLAFAATAAEVDDLYGAQTVVTGAGEVNRLVGFAQCLTDVLVKVSGDPRLIGDPRVTALAGKARDYVVGFHYHDQLAGIPIHDEQGTRDRPFDLRVEFDPARIDAVLHALAHQPWGASRPRVAVFLGIDNGAVKYLLASDGDRGLSQREALVAAAGLRGIPVALPTSAALTEAGLSFANLQTAKPAAGDVALVGHLIWQEAALGWVADWRLEAQGKIYRWWISGVNFDTAFRNAMSGTAQILSGHGQPK
jgi:hypothetical protein